ncbi:GIY-YIG nuclease family protein [Enterococcus faecalis]|uniref:GIY-YIG nuclease family protein n=1 Tax=Enterococcus faecalis TaxID=1351 RepID=A0A3N3PF90_ENTFL|nr:MULTISPECIES: GIY-YIG nuclease family protein [Enterococcus]EGP5710188.1 GIY-YIG nuclease family protein [Enterococcus faecium]EMF0090849.1 GIY-YIG nuclease family protein [Enterococcus hirae]EGO2644867.1 GIY-YIG nuclease family protein [Enterococcus faecalis]EGO8254432.1 GIY-YIG nuclease family protein [Enterococcus faecalis]EGO8512977.1 GIY-YIG nuclease family protein [Enterococcus faecalis]
MDKRYSSLDDIMNSDLFDQITAPSRKQKQIFYDLEVENFMEIVKFYQENGREPEKTNDSTRLSERTLASRLIGIRRNPDRIAKLKEYDEVGLLSPSKQFDKEIKSLDDILNFGSSELLGDLAQSDFEKSIFNTSRFREVENKPDFVAKRKHMRDFSKYEPLFRNVQKEIAAGTRKILPFKNYEIKQGSFLIQKGTVLYVESIGEKFKTNNGEENARLHVIYENGTESNVLLRSLAANLYRTGSGGKMITDNIDNLIDGIQEEDISSGYIYVLRSLSDNPQIQEIDNLYKIGVTTGSVEKRIANAINESTYLYAPVEIVTKYHVFNLDAAKFENAIHKVLRDNKLDVEIVGVNGRMIVPREWFVIPVDQLDFVINEIITKVIINS